MYRLLETIRIENGKMMNLSYHEDRVNRSLKTLFGKRELPALSTLITISSSLSSGIYKCRFLYSDVDFQVTFEPYEKRNIVRLILIEKPDIKYDLKYADRSIFMNLIPEDQETTEIIFTRQGFLTDTRYTNIAFERDGQWISPNSPLLEGTQRAWLIDNGIIQLDQIKRKNLGEFSKIRLFNAMMPWDDCIELSISQISYYD